MRTKSKSHEPETIIDRLRSEIVASGLTHYALAQASGCDRQQVRRFVAGSAGLGGDTIGRIAAVLGLELVRPKGRRPTPAPARKVPTPE